MSKRTPDYTKPFDPRKDHCPICGPTVSFASGCTHSLSEALKAWNEEKRKWLENTP